MSHYSHNLDQIKPHLSGFGQHISQSSPVQRAARVAHLREVLLDAQRELAQLLAEET